MDHRQDYLDEIVGWGLWWGKPRTFISWSLMDIPANYLALGQTVFVCGNKSYCKSLGNWYHHSMEVHGVDLWKSVWHRGRRINGENILETPLRAIG